MTDQDDYPYPVSQLLTHGPIQTSATGQWFDYVGHYGLDEIDVPLLISLAYDVKIDRAQLDQRDAPIHACRALGQLGDAAADTYLVRLLDNHEDSGLTETILVALSMLGPRSLTVLQEYFQDPKTCHWSQALAAEGVQIFTQRHPQYREQAVQFLAQALADYPQNTPELNGFLIQSLVELKATEVIKEIEAALQSGNVEKGICGTWPAVQVELGLASEADFSTEELSGDDDFWAAKPMSEATITPIAKPQQRRTADLGLAADYSIAQYLRR